MQRLLQNPNLSIQSRLFRQVSRFILTKHLSPTRSLLFSPPSALALSLSKMSEASTDPSSVFQSMAISTSSASSLTSSSSSASSTSISSASSSTSISSTSSIESVPTSSPTTTAGGEEVKLLSDADIIFNLQAIQTQIQDAATGCGRDPGSVTLVAVSKTKPSDYIRALYNHGHREFGENYFQELETKAGELPADIKWHFIGHLQSSKAAKLVRAVTNLTVESVDSMKLAQKLNAAVQSMNRPPLDIYIQVHTSDEETKSGIDPSELVAFARELRSSCPSLSLKGLMTIGAPTDSSGSFKILVESREALAAEMGVPSSALSLSMGMSGDFQMAIENGSTNVRIGSVLFGPRVYKK